MAELTSRQYRLYDLLKSNPNHWWTQKEICDSIHEFVYIDDDRNHCVSIGDDQRAINDSMVVDKIIITDRHCFKIASKEEYVRFRSKLITRIKNTVAQVNSWDAKYERNGQCKLFNNVLNELKPDNEQFHETFLNQPGQIIISDTRMAYIDLYCRIAYITNKHTERDLETNHVKIYDDNGGIIK